MLDAQGLGDIIVDSRATDSNISALFAFKDRSLYLEMTRLSSVVTSVKLRILSASAIPYFRNK